MPSLANGCYTITLPPDGSALAVRDGVLVVSLSNFSGEIRILSHCPSASGHSTLEKLADPTYPSQPTMSQPLPSQQQFLSQPLASLPPQMTQTHQVCATQPPMPSSLGGMRLDPLESPSSSQSMSPVQSPVQRCSAPSPTPSPLLAPSLLPHHYAHEQLHPVLQDNKLLHSNLGHHPNHQHQATPGNPADQLGLHGSSNTTTPEHDTGRHLNEEQANGSPVNSIYAAFLQSPTQNANYRQPHDNAAQEASQDPFFLSSQGPTQAAAQPCVSSEQLAQCALHPSETSARGTAAAKSLAQCPPNLPYNLHKRARVASLLPSDSDTDNSDNDRDEDFPVDNYDSQYSPDPAPHTTVADRGASQGKRVRFADDGSSQNPSQIPEDDPKAPWTIVATAPPKEGEAGGHHQPSTRWGASFTRIDLNMAILIGGESEQNGLYDEIHTLTLPAGTWTRGLASNQLGLLRLTIARSWHSATKVGSSIFVFGGEVQRPGGERQQTSDLLSLDTNYGLWVDLQSSGAKPSPRAGHCSALLPDGETVCVFGGISGSRWLADCHLLNVPQLTWERSKNGARSASPSARSYATLTAVGDYVVLFGGNNKTRSFTDVFIGTVQGKKDSTKSMLWTEPLLLGAGPAARTGHFAVASPSKQGLIVGGGWDDLGAKRVFHSDLWELLINSRAECRWRLIHKGWSGPVPPPSQPGARAGAAVCDFGQDESTVRSNPVLFGGFRGFQYFSDAYELDLTKC
jgi:hypothetical protein